MARRFPQLCVYILLLSGFLQIDQIRCLRRLTRRKLSVEADDIRSILSSALDSNPSGVIAKNNKRDTSSEDLASAENVAEDNVASESKDAPLYEDEVDEDDSGQQQQQQRDLDDSKYKRSVESELSADRADVDAYEDGDLHGVKDVVKREAKNEDYYDEDPSADASVSSDGKVVEVETRSTNARSRDEVEKVDNRREIEANAGEVNSDPSFEKQIEDQIQLRIDAIKEDMKREIERKQRVREIEANNAKYDELEFNREDSEVDNGEVAGDVASDTSKRSIPRDPGAADEVANSGQSVRSKRSDLKTVVENEEKRESALVLPVKKRSPERRVTLVERRDVPSGRRKDRSSILIPERGHAEVKDELPGDLTLDANLRLARSDPDNRAASGASRSTRSAPSLRDQATRYRRDMADEAENNEGAVQEGNFLFAARDKPGCRMRRRRSRGRKKARKRPRHSKRRHRAVRESSVDDEELEEERDKRAMPLDEDAALEYKESFGGFQSDTSGALGRFKRIRRSSEAS